MDLSNRLVQVKSSAKEEDLLTYSPEDIWFLFGNVTCPEGLILNHSDPLECFVLFPATSPIQDIYNLNESPSWVGAPMQLAMHKPRLSIILIVMNLLEDKALEEVEEFEFIPIEALKPMGARGPDIHSTPKKKTKPVATALAKEFKHLESQELQPILSAIQLETKSRQDTSVSPVHKVSSILQTLLKEGALKTNIHKLSAFSGERAKGEVSFEQWSY